MNVYVASLGAFTIAIVLILIYFIILHKRTLALLSKSQELLAAERAGRITGEKKMRKIIQERSGDESGKQSGFHEKYTRIGCIKSPFRQRNGTPRQGGLVPSVRSEIEFDHSKIQPENSLDGIEAYSHVWLIWEFHQNTNATSTFKAKIKPPRADGMKVGVYATRTPHRYNNIGLSLVSLISLSPDRRRMIIGGADLVDGTPILDIKPYTPAFESIPNATVPAWVGTEKGEVFNVVWSHEAIVDVDRIVNNGLTQFYQRNESSHLMQTIAEICKVQDLRSRVQKARGTEEYSFAFDNLLIGIRIQSKEKKSKTSSNDSVRQRRPSTRSQSKIRINSDNDELEKNDNVEDSVDNSGFESVLIEYVTVNDIKDTQKDTNNKDI